MNLSFPAIIAQTLLLLMLGPLLSGLIRNWKAKLQNRRGPRIWQPFFDYAKFLRKDMVISEHASWIFSITPYVTFLTALTAGLLLPWSQRKRRSACSAACWRWSVCSR